MHAARGIEVSGARLDRNNNASIRRLGHVVSKSLGHRIEGQSPVDEPLDKFQATHLLLSLGADGSVILADDTARHRFTHSSREERSKATLP